MSDVPARYWMNDANSPLGRAVYQFVDGTKRLDAIQVELVRAYCQQWMDHPSWTGPALDLLRVGIRKVSSQSDLREWLHELDLAGAHSPI